MQTVGDHAANHPSRRKLELGQINRVSLLVILFSMALALLSAYFGDDITGKVLMLVSGGSVMLLAVWVLYYTRSKPFIKGIATAAMALAVISQLLNISIDFEAVNALPLLDNASLVVAVRRTMLIFGIILFLTALYLAVVESGAIRERLWGERNFFSRVMEGTSTLICVVKADGTISYVNKAVLQITGRDAEELLGRDWWECFSAVPLSDPQRTFDLFATQDVLSHTLTLRIKSGEKRHIAWNSNNRYDADGNLVESFRFGKDITEKRAFEAERDRLATAIEQSHELVAITDSYGVVQYVNPAFLETAGYKREEVIGKTMVEIGGEQYSEELLDSLRNTLLNGEVWRAHINHSTPDKRQLDLHVTVSPISNPEGKLKGFVATYRDVSHETELERQLRQAQKMQAIGTLAGGVAHDFNNILSPVIGYTEMAMHETPRESPAYKYLVNIMDAGLRAKDLVKQILTFSRQADQERKPMRLAPILREAMKLVRGSLPASIEIHEDIKSSCPPVMADPTQMHQVLMNLCTNAYHAMEENGGTLRVGLCLERITKSQAGDVFELDPGDYCCLTVSDTGVGIDDSVRARIFEPYFTTKSEGKGLGLGLATVHGIVQSHNGIIAVDSQKGIGTTVRVYLPILTDDAVPEVPQVNKSVAGSGEKILVVDDEFAVLQVVKRILNRLGYEVIACSTPHEALDIFKKAPEHFDLVLTDLSMPKMNGVGLAKALHKLRADIPVVLTTGFHTKSLQKEAEEAWIRAIAPKPLTLQELGTIIHAALHKKPAADEVDKEKWESKT